MWGRFRRRRRVHEIEPDEIFLDSTNLPSRDDPQFEGRVVRPVSNRAIIGIGVFFFVVVAVFSGRSFELGVVKGATYAQVSRDNRLDRSLLFATRGLVYDRRGKEIAWNEASLGEGATTTPYAERHYTDQKGLAHVLGFVRYPKADASGVWWREEYAGVSGIEQAFDDELAGENGSTMVEVNARGEVISQNLVVPPVAGTDIVLSIDAELQSVLHEMLSTHATRQRFEGGAAVIMDVETGELLALTSFPEYDNKAFTAGDAEAIEWASSHSSAPLLNRAVNGLYAPGSIVKPIFAVGALNEGIISPEKKIESKGALVLPNPFNPDQPSIFRDWTVHGWVDMREAIAVSSDEYFYTIGGGFGSQRGLGITKIDEYARRFGLGESTGFTQLGEKVGVVPTPEWKAQVFGPDDPWRIGNTYHTSIGQYGFQITPMQAVRFTAAIANGGKLMVPTLRASSTPEYSEIGISDEYLQVAREGMRMAVTSTRSDATVKSLNIGGIEIAAKTGTAEVGTRNQFMNSWSVGFWPASNPRYAYAVVLEKAPAGTLSGASPALRPFFEWLIENRPEYIK